MRFVLLNILFLQAVSVTYANEAVRVCITLDQGFDNLADPSMAPEAVTNNLQLRGFNTDGREYVLTQRLGLNYTVRVFSTYATLQVAVRLGDECDMGFSAFFIIASRDKCVTDAQTCRPLAELPASSVAEGDLTPYRCCIDYSTSYIHYGVAILYKTPSKRSFFSALFQSVTGGRRHCPYCSCAHQRLGSIPTQRAPRAVRSFLHKLPVLPLPPRRRVCTYTVACGTEAQPSLS